MLAPSEGDRGWQAAKDFLAMHIPPPDASEVVDIFKDDSWDVRTYGGSDEYGASVLFQKIPDREGIAVEFTETQRGELSARVEQVGPNVAAMHDIQTRLGTSAKHHLGVETLLPRAGSVLIVGKDKVGELRPAVEVSVGPRPSAMPTTVRG